MVASKIYPGELLQLKSGLLQPGESFKIGRASILPNDVFRCIGTDTNSRLLVVRRTGTGFNFTLETLASKFEAIGFDGLEPITL